MALKQPIDDGGPAFPRTYGIAPNGVMDHWQQDGMSLRDHFAGLAMQAFASDPQMAIGVREAAEQAGISAPDMMARTAYGLADAMIAERNRTEVSDD